MVDHRALNGFIDHIIKRCGKNVRKILNRPAKICYDMSKEGITMTKEQIRTKFDRWAERVGHTPFENDLDNATLLLSYDDKQTSTTFSTVAVYAVAVHTDHVHVFLFSVQTVWQLDAQDDTGKVLDERYRVIVAL